MRSLLCIFGFLILFASKASASPEAVDGVLDLRGQNLSRSIDMRGQWNFIWQHLLDPEAYTAHEGLQKPVVIPGSWYQNDHGFKMFGYGTYRLRIKVDRQEQLAISIPEIWCASRLYLDGKEIAAYGKVGPDAKHYEGGTGMTFVVFTPSSTTFDLVMQISNYDIFLSGITLMPTIGASAVMINVRDRDLALDTLVMGALFIMGIYHLLLFAMRTEDKSTLWFAIVCFFVGTYTMAIGSEVMITIWRHVPFTWRLRALNFSWMVATHAFIWFAYVLFQPYYKKRMALIGASIASLHHVICLTTGPFYFVNISLLLQFVIVPILGYTCYAAWKSRKLRSESSAIFLIGILVLVVAVINDMLSIHRTINTPVIGGFGVIAFIVVQSYLLAHRFAMAFVKLKFSEREIRDLSDNLKEVNENLEMTVEEKTRDIRSIMEHIPIGIFIMAGPDGLIARDHSRELKHILLEDKLEGREAAKLLFSNSQLSEDEKSQAIGAIHASLNELDLNFDANSGALPLELRRTDPQGHMRIYDLTWDKMVNDEGVTEKILVTIRDMTELKGLQMKAQVHQEELEIVGEILGVSPVRFNRFIRSAQDLLQENDKLLRAADLEKRDPELLKILFINIHTIKGAARSLYFKKFTQVLHEIEQYFAELKRSNAVEWDAGRIRTDQAAMMQMVERYDRIAHEKIGRVTGGRQSLDFSLEEVQQYYRQLHRLLTTQPISGELHEPIEQMALRLFARVHTPVKNVIQEISMVLPALAKDLQKDLPQVDLQDGGLVATVQAEEILHNTFVHLLRNSMDHGIETPDERVRRKKPTQPTISIRLEWDEPCVKLIYWDDGRGLNLDRLRAAAIQNQLLTAEQAEDPQALANLLLTSNLSTAQAVTDISGRGVGMGAIRQHVEQQGGQVRILLQGAASGSFIAFRIEMQIPSRFFAQPFDVQGILEAS